MANKRKNKYLINCKDKIKILWNQNKNFFLKKK